MLTRWRWAALAAGLLSTGCLMGAIAAGTGVVVVGAGVIAFTCYDRITVTVTDRLTGTALCDAKITFTKGSSVSEATSCGQVALSAGKYKMRVTRPGLVPFEQPVEVVKGKDCGGTIQTMYVALERPNYQQAPQQVVPAPPPPPTPSVAAPAAPPPPTPVEVTPAPSAASSAAPAPAPSGSSGSSNGAFPAP